MQIPRLWLRPLQSCSDDSKAFGNLGGVPTTTRVVDTYTDTFLSVLSIAGGVSGCLGEQRVLKARQSGDLG